MCCLELAPLSGKLPKTRVRTLYKNWRGIFLPFVESKVICKIILERMNDSLDDRNRDTQAVVRKVRSFCEQTATLRIIVE